MKTKITLITTLVILVLTMAGCTPSNDSKSKDTSKDSNQYYTNLSNWPDLIVKGKVLSEKGRVNKTFGSETKDENSAEVIMPCIIYDVEVIESLKNPENHKNFSLALMNTEQTSFGSFNLAKVDIGKEYLFLLKYDREKNDYVTLNYENGVYGWNNNSNDMKSLTDQNIIDYDMLKSTTKKLNIK